MRWPTQQRVRSSARLLVCRFAAFVLCVCWFAKRREKVAVVVNWFRDDLAFLERVIDCEKHDLYVYLRRAKGESEPVWPVKIRHCLRLITLELPEAAERQVLGKVHIAYLEHISRQYNRLHSATIFLKAGATDAEMLKSVRSGVGFKDLVSQSHSTVEKHVDRVHIATRGTFNTGLGRFPLFYRSLTLYLNALDAPSRQIINSTSLKAAYVTFRSTFVASRERIRRVPRASYKKLLHMLQETSPANLHCYNSSSPSPSACGNLILERIWASVMRCSAPYVIFHRLHQNGTWNPVLPWTCFDDITSMPVYTLEVCQQDLVDMQEDWHSSILLFKLYILAYFSITVHLGSCMGSEGVDAAVITPLLQKIFGIALAPHPSPTRLVITTGSVERQLPICAYYQACVRALSGINGLSYTPRPFITMPVEMTSDFESKLQELVRYTRKFTQ